MTLEDAKVAYITHKFSDPYPKIAAAFLNGWDIKNYIETVGMVFPFRREDLNGITYDVRISGNCLFWEECDGKQIERSIIVDKSTGVRTIVLRPNSITFVTLEPYFQIPNYIALRYNFKIKQVYRGLLLGTGPIIDPGFHGYLSIPIHNPTKNEYTIFVDEPLISVEFTKINAYKRRVYPSEVSADFAKTKDFSGPEKRIKDYVNDALKVMPTKENPSVTNPNNGIFNSVPSLEIAIKKAKEESIEAVKENTTATNATILLQNKQITRFLYCANSLQIRICISWE